MSFKIEGVPARVNVATANVAPGTIFSTPLNGGSLAIALQNGLALHLYWMKDQAIRPQVIALGDNPNELYEVIDDIEIRLGGQAVPSPLRPTTSRNFCDEGSLMMIGGHICIGVDYGGAFVLVDLVDSVLLHSNPAGPYFNDWTLWRVAGDKDWPLASVNLKPSS